MVEAHATESLDIAVIGGDGIGPEVVAEGLKVLSAVTSGSGPKITTTEYDLGARRWHATGETLPDSVLEEIRGHDAILLGAVGDPGVPSGVLERGLLLRLRFALDHYVNLRPARLYPGVTSPLAVERVAPSGIDFVVVREGTEGPYTGNGGALRVGTPHEIATEVSVNTRFGVERVVRDAFARGPARPRRHLTLVHKHNVLVHAGHLWRRTVDEVGAEFPDVTTDYLHVDAATIFLVTDPGRFDVIVTDNLFGDIITDLAAAIAGGIGLAAVGNINPDRTVPEHVRAGARLGARHRRPGQGRPDRHDPVGRHAARPPRRGDEAARVEAAVAADLAERGDAVRVDDRRSATPSPRASDPPPAATHGAARVACPHSDGDASRSRRAQPARQCRVRPASDVRPAAPGRAHVFGSTSTPLQRRTRCRRPARGGARQPGVRQDLHRPHGHDDRGRPTAAGTTAGSSRTGRSARPGRRGAALRAGDLRGPEGLPPRGRLGVDRSGPRPTPTRFARRPAGWPCPSCRRGLPRVAARRWSAPTRRGCPPDGGEASLYLRPFMFATEAFLGVRPAQRGDLLRHRLARPAPTSRRPEAGLDLALEDYTRAAPGGTGAAKCGGNYAASLVAQAEAHAHGCDQVVFLDAVERTVGRGARRHEPVLRAPATARLVTPALTGTILEGITRVSILELAEELGHWPRSAASPSRSGATASRPVTSPRSSPAAPPRWSRRWDGWRGTAARC